ncbi:hypothetical protein D3C80_1667580 [compost metagenome]
MRCHPLQLIQLLLRQNLIPLPQGQAHTRRYHVRVIRVHQLKAIQRLTHQLIFVAGFADAHLLQ